MLGYEYVLVKIVLLDALVFAVERDLFIYEVVLSDEFKFFVFRRGVGHSERCDDGLASSSVEVVIYDMFLVAVERMCPKTAPQGTG